MNHRIIDETLNQSSLRGLRILLHQAYKITNNIYESFYLVLNDIYHKTLDTVSWFEDKKNKQLEHVMAYNMLKFFQDFEVFKEDIANDSVAIKEAVSV
ncbi:hypothetical protein [Bacillus mycoides]|uniref:hypothetical protein n=1 Tax=Bacillus mycoides TaxID=1405 RepID=UPI000871D9AF|nr:hypothetical protein [Bacillus mycoides]OFD41662.1 hypothetical protein BWGOE2_29840 [Bacillus mycoides]OFD45119.1 hypothetical protein BWGOE1_30980 [Bacillus mycoides]